MFGLRENEGSEKYLESFKSKIKPDDTVEVRHLQLTINRIVEDGGCDFLILQDGFDERTPLNLNLLQTIHENHPALRLILILNNERKQTSFMSSLLNIPCYDGIFFCDATVENTLEIIESPREKKDARIYYGVGGQAKAGSENHILMSELILATAQVSDDELEETYEYCLKNLRPEDREIYHKKLPADIVEKLQAKENPNILAYLASKSGDEKKVTKGRKIVFNHRTESEDNDTGDIKKSIADRRVVEKTRTSIIVKQKNTINSEIPNDYKKLVVVTGSSDSGKSSIAASLMYELASRKVSVSGVDLTQYLDMSVNFQLPEDERSMKDLLMEVELNPYIVNNFLDIYGGAINGEGYSGIETLAHKYLFSNALVVLVEADYRPTRGYYDLISQADQVFIVHSADPKASRYDSEVSDILSNVTLDKAVLVLNKSTGYGRKKNLLRKALTSTIEKKLVTGIISVPFSMEFMNVQWKHYESKGFKQSSFGDFSKSITEIGYHIYPKGRTK